MFRQRELFFSEYCVSFFREITCGHSFLNEYGIFHDFLFFISIFHIYCFWVLPTMNYALCNVFDRYFEGIELIPPSSSCIHLFHEWSFFYYKRTIAGTHSFKFTVLCRTRVVAKGYYSYQLWYLLGFRNVYIERSILFYDIHVLIAGIDVLYSSVIISWEHLKWSMCQEHCVYFTTFIANIYYCNIYCNQQEVCGWFEKIRRVVLLEENHCSSALLKVPIFPTELVAAFVWKILC